MAIPVVFTAEVGTYLVDDHQAAEHIKKLGAELKTHFTSLEGVEVQDRYPGVGVYVGDSEDEEVGTAIFGSVAVIFDSPTDRAEVLEKAATFESAKFPYITIEAPTKESEKERLAKREELKKAAQEYLQSDSYKEAKFGGGKRADAESVASTESSSTTSSGNLDVENKDNWF